MSASAKARLTEERKDWRKSRCVGPLGPDPSTWWIRDVGNPMQSSGSCRLLLPHSCRPFGFVAKPRSAPDGSFNLLLWDCIIPGKQGTDWEGGLYPVQLIFSGDYPSKAPTAVFPPGFLHPNIYPDGHVSLTGMGVLETLLWSSERSVKLLACDSDFDTLPRSGWRAYWVLRFNR